MPFLDQGFHRTHSYKQAQDIATNSYKIHHTSSNKLGANGLNLFLDWHSVCNRINEETYGRFVVRFNIDPTNCLVIDLERCNRYFGHSSIQRQLDFLEIKANPDLDLTKFQADVARKGPQGISGAIAKVYILDYQDNRKKINGIILRTTANQPYACIYNLMSVAANGVGHSLLADEHDAPTGVPYTAVNEKLVRWIKFRATHDS